MPDLNTLADQMEGLDRLQPSLRIKTLEDYAKLPEDDLEHLNRILRFRRAQRPTLDLSK